MSIYGVHALCRRILHDVEFRSLAKEDPDLAIAMMPLSEMEQLALQTGDVKKLHQMGASGFLLLILSRFEIFGLDLQSYNARMLETQNI